MLQSPPGRTGRRRALSVAATALATSRRPPRSRAGSGSRSRGRARRRMAARRYAPRPGSRGGGAGPPSATPQEHLRRRQARTHLPRALAVPFRRPGIRQQVDPLDPLQRRDVHGSAPKLMTCIWSDEDARRELSVKPSELGDDRDETSRLDSGVTRHGSAPTAGRQGAEWPDSPAPHLGLGLCHHPDPLFNPADLGKVWLAPSAVSGRPGTRSWACSLTGECLYLQLMAKACAATLDEAVSSVVRAGGGS